MSRRHHGRPHHHAPAAVDRPRRAAGVSPSATPQPEGSPAANARPAGAVPPELFQATGQTPDAPRPPSPVVPPMPVEPPLPVVPPMPVAAPTFAQHQGPRPEPSSAAAEGLSPAAHGPAPAAPAGPAPMATAASRPPGLPVNNAPDRNGQCTAPQLRRFIKSRPYVPMHELRRRFGIDGGDDVVTPVRLEPGWVYVGLPTREGSLLGELLRAGEIGYELSLDPRSPIVIGVYPMRPIPRG